MILEKIDQDLLALAKQSDNDLKDIYACLLYTSTNLNTLFVFQLINLHINPSKDLLFAFFLNYFPLCFLN